MGTDNVDRTSGLTYIQVHPIPYLDFNKLTTIDKEKKKNQKGKKIKHLHHIS
jgi:hypothetical protein